MAPNPLLMIERFFASPREGASRPGPLSLARSPLDRRIWLHGGGRLELGERVRFGVGTAPIELHVAPGAVLTIGDDALIEGGASIEVALRVSIGPRARVGPFAKVIDNHFHSASGDRHQRPPSAPVVIERDVVLGPRAIVLPGAHVGAGSHVAAAAVVARRVPPYSSVSGVPAVVSPLPLLVGRACTPLAGGVTTHHRLTVDMCAWGPPELPWIKKAKARLRALALFRKCSNSEHIHAYGPVGVVAGGAVSVGARAFFLGGMIPTQLSCAPGARLTIGEDSGFNYGTSIEAHRAIDIGKRCMVASMVSICDEVSGVAAPIVVGDDVWIAHGATLLPGAVIGSGSVVSAGSVVSGSIPVDSLAVGCPARAIGLTFFRRPAPVGRERESAR